MLSVSCATGQDAWNKYEAGGQHRAYATGNKGVVGAAWNYPTSEQAIAAAINSCNREGEIGCHITHLNGKPYNETSPKKSEVTQPKSALTPKPVSAPKSVSTPKSAPAPKPVFAAESAPAPKPVFAAESVPTPKPVLALKPTPTPVLTLASTGTGFFLSTKGQIITNAHVVDGCSFSRIFYQNNTYDVSLVQVDPHNDLALLQSTITDHKTAQLEIDRIPRLGEPVIAFVYPLSSVLSSKPEVADGILSSTAGLNNDSRYFQISAPVQPGNSGGPLLDKFGRVIGIVTAKLDDTWSIENTGAIPRNVNFAIKTLIVKAFLDSNGVVMNKPRQAPRQMSSTDIAEAADLYTVQIGCFK
jgi:S1-C subfamily serine protease